MPRKTPEWIEPNHDKPIPPRVKTRIISLANQCCANCRMRVGYGGEVDHTIALILGGENRESNLRFLCKNCHAAKTKADLAAKSRSAQAQRKLGPLKREQSAMSKNYERVKEKYKFNWKTHRWEPIAP